MNKPVVGSITQLSNTISIADYHKLVAANKNPARAKYGNVRCEMDGIKFDSKKERDYYSDLCKRRLAGEIRSVGVHPFWDISFNGHSICRVEMDFAFFDIKENRTRVVDVKGMDNPLSKLKRKLLEAQTGFIVEVVT